MRQSGSGSRRPRGRHHNNGGNAGGTNMGNTQNRPRTAASLRHQTFDSNGPDVRVRGNAWQVYEKYLALARDATTSGDHIMAESYLQHAEHYYRITEAIEEATSLEQRKSNPPAPPATAKQPDMPPNYYTPDGKLPPEQPAVQKKPEPSAAPADAAKTEAEPAPKPKPRARPAPREPRNVEAAAPATPPQPKPIEPTDATAASETSSSPFFSLDNPEATEGSKPQKLVAQ